MHVALAKGLRHKIYLASVSLRYRLSRATAISAASRNVYSVQRFHKITFVKSLPRPKFDAVALGESRRLLPFRRKNAIFAANMALRAEAGAPGFHPNEL